MTSKIGHRCPLFFCEINGIIKGKGVVSMKKKVLGLVVAAVFVAGLVIGAANAEIVHAQITPHPPCECFGSIVPFDFPNQYAACTPPDDPINP